MNDEQSTGGVRRFGRKDRKRSLDPRGPLFPPEEFSEDAPDESSTAQVPDVAEPDLDSVLASPASKVTASEQSQSKAGTGNPKVTAPRERHVMANLLTVVFLLGTIVVGGLVALIAVNPNTPLNPFPPFTPLPIFITATFLPPTTTPEGTFAPTATFTPLAIDAGGTNQTAFTFMLVNEQPIYAPNANAEGCNWSSIAGTITDKSGTALDGYRVHIFGNGIDDTVFSGAAITFGAGGFELFLNGTAQEQSYTVQLLSPQREPLSPAYSVTTRAICDQNVAVLAFVES